MGITPALLSVLMERMPAESVLCLSCPDFVMPSEVFTEIVGKKVPSSDTYSGWHGRKYAFPDVHEAFKAMGAEKVRFVDVVASRDCEDIADLNYPQDFGLHDLVIDPGTTEHCANIWQATVNAANSVKVGGAVIHNVPLTMLNHGLFCPQPTFYADTYADWDVSIYATDGEALKPLPKWARFQLPPELVMVVVAVRNNDKPVAIPVQKKYQLNQGLT
jgi:hypothetical protein